MHGYRLFRLHQSQTDAEPALWADLGMVDLDLGTDPAGVVGEQFGRGEFLLLSDEQLIVDFEVP